MTKTGLEIHADIDALRRELKTAEAQFRKFNANAMAAASGVKRFEQASDDAGKKVGFLNTSFGKLLTSVTGGIIGAGAITRVVGFFQNWSKAIIGASSAMQELDSKARIVFGDTFAQVEARVQAISKEVGRSRSAILQFAADMGAVIDAAGLTREATAGMSTEFAKLAVDLASFHNTTDIEAFNALRSAITGELEPLKRFGVVMTQANLQAYALNRGIKQKIETMSQAQLTALRYNYILDRTSTAHGDAARTADSYANQARRLEGELRELNEQLGQSATPALASGLSVLNTVIQNVRIFVGLLAQDIRSLFALLNVNVGGASFGKTVKSAIGNVVGSVPVFGPLLKAGGGLLANRVGSRVAEQRASQAVDNSPLAVPTLEEMMQQYAGTAGRGGGGGKPETAEDVLKDILKGEEDIIRALGEEAKANKENLDQRKEELELRKKLGILTKREEEELRRINNRLDYKGKRVDDLTNKWEDLQGQIKDTQKTIDELNQKMKDGVEEFSASLNKLEEDRNRRKGDAVAKLLEEQEDLMQRGDLSPEQRERLLQVQKLLQQAKTASQGNRQAEIEGMLSNIRGNTQFGPDGKPVREAARKRWEELQAQLASLQQNDPFTRGQALFDIKDDPFAQIDFDIEERRSELQKEHLQLQQEINAEIAKETAKQNELKAQATTTQSEIVRAIEERRIATDANFKAIEDRTKSHVDQQVAEYDRLLAKMRQVGLGKAPEPGLNRALGGPVYGPGGPTDDKVKAWLSNGEYVINAAATRLYRPLIERINSMTLPRFAAGGPVTNNSSQTINVSQNNYGEAARLRADPRYIRWQFLKR